MFLQYLFPQAMTIVLTSIEEIPIKISNTYFTLIQRSLDRRAENSTGEDTQGISLDNYRSQIDETIVWENQGSSNRRGQTERSKVE